ncbi:hypothetical protein [uncultured Pseudokineococcus sp.]|uniref:hypothetical protein n=1 Tax=uncultured Pseudokineococcus sp. TaxID=1642928 RepID=UPI002605A05F|nr:hypothetical protein [uncultured Pseudokineococcus sp.]
MSTRTDREDLSAQEAAVAAARDGLRDAVEDLARASDEEARPRGAGGRPGTGTGTGSNGGTGTDPSLAAVAAEARDLARALRSRARRPPAADTAPLAGAVSAAQREAARSDAWDDAARAVREAESALDAAVVDLASARGEDV